MITSAHSTYICPIDDVCSANHALVMGDCRDILRTVADGSVNLVHTSPPYNIHRQYRGFRDRQDVDRYLVLLKEVIDEVYRVMTAGGSVFWQVGYTAFGDARNSEAGGITLLDASSIPLFEQAGFQLWDRIVWQYFGSMAFKSKFTNRHETILWMVKPDRSGRAAPVFHLDEVREKSKSYDGRNHLLGRNPGNVWASERVAFGSLGHTSHIAVFPEEVSEKIVRACSQPGDRILDPFSGSGTLAKVALTLQRSFLACEISDDYIRESDERLRMWGASETENLAIGLLVKYGFHSRPGRKTVRHLADVLEMFAVECSEIEDFSALRAQVAEILSADRVTKGIKNRKQQMWEKYDEIVNDRDEGDEIIAADRALSFCFAHRKRWNGVRRYLTAGTHLSSLANEVANAGGPESYLKRICSRASARFVLEDGHIQCLRTDPGLGTSEKVSTAPSREVGQEHTLWSEPHAS